MRHANDPSFWVGDTDGVARLRFAAIGNIA